MGFAQQVLWAALQPVAGVVLVLFVCAVLRPFATLATLCGWVKEVACGRLPAWCASPLCVRIPRCPCSCTESVQVGALGCACWPSACQVVKLSVPGCQLCLGGGFEWVEWLCACRADCMSHTVDFSLILLLRNCMCCVLLQQSLHASSILHTCTYHTHTHPCMLALVTMYSCCTWVYMPSLRVHRVAALLHTTSTCVYDRSEVCVDCVTTTTTV